MGFLWRAIGEIRNPAGSGPLVAPEADAAAAARKVRRLRGPLAEAAMDLRARLDPEYLGVGLPGQTGEMRDQAQEDMQALHTMGLTQQHSEEIEHQRASARADMARLGERLDAGLLDDLADKTGVARRDPERLRAVAIAYRADLDGLRSRLSAGAVLEELLEVSGRTPVPRGFALPAPRRYLAFRRWWRSRPKPRGKGAAHLWRLVRMDLHGSRRCLDAWDAARRDPDREQAAAAATLEDLLRHPGQITEPLVTLRTVQTLTRIDATTLLEHIWSLAGFEDDDDYARNRTNEVSGTDPEAEAIPGATIASDVEPDAGQVAP